jgi:tryptophan synthase alpha chain
MSRIAAVFNKPDHKALIAYVTVGYPNIEATLKVVPLLTKNGCDIIELGIPFSDPLADGVTIQKASFEALKNGISPSVCLDTARKLRQKVDTPLVFMSYYNPIFSYGLEDFCTDSKNAGVDGLIIPDLPPEEGVLLETISAENRLDLIYLLAPTSTEQRIRSVAGRSRGFIYLVSVTGVTGARENISSNLGTFVKRVRRFAHQPLCVGFGISSTKQAVKVASESDGVIVGSRLIQLMESDPSMIYLQQFVTGLRKALDNMIHS